MERGRGASMIEGRVVIRTGATTENISHGCNGSRP